MKTFQITIYQPFEPTFRVDEEQNIFNKDLYKEVYKTTFTDYLDNISAEDKLEKIFAKFNSDERPSDFKGHSLSVGDIVTIDDDAYVCDSFGWNKIRFVAFSDYNENYKYNPYGIAPTEEERAAVEEN